MNRPVKANLELRFHGRIIDHLGIQMYSSPVAAIAELVANAWDADATIVKILLPKHPTSGALVVEDNGIGMTWAECQERYLNVGYCRRAKSTTEISKGGRRILGRKGIGKFAGFGIAKIIEIDTTSRVTGERTVFAMDVTKLRGTEYVEGRGKLIAAKRYPKNAAAKSKHGTIIRLTALTVKRRPSADQFRKSMARRFLLQQTAASFDVRVNGKRIPDDEDFTAVEYDFPKDFVADELKGITVKDGWGVEKLNNGKQIRWRVRFYRDPIDEEELRGVSVFSGVKIVQCPFLFNLSGGLGGQHGQEYVSGQVKADYLDELNEDIVATDRQQLNWETEEAAPLLAWGQMRVKQLLRIWKDKRGEAKRAILETKLSSFKDRLDNLPQSEQRTVRGALVKIGTIETLNEDQFTELAVAILKSWEMGRLHELIREISQKGDLEPAEFLRLLTEADVLTALNIAEVVKTKLESLKALSQLVKRRKLENKLRDFIAARPYLLDSQWETFRKETKVEGMLASAAKAAGLTSSTYTGRLDLAMSGYRKLLIVEFMRPGLTLDFDHAERCQQYISILREDARANTALEIDEVTGLIVADSLSTRRGMSERLSGLKKDGILAFDWQALIKTAESKLREFLDIVAERAPDDNRLTHLKQDSTRRH